MPHFYAFFRFRARVKQALYISRLSPRRFFLWRFPMKNFEIVILAGPRYVLRRPGQQDREFTAIKEALDYTAKLPGGDDGRKYVTDNSGRRMKVVW